MTNVPNNVGTRISFNAEVYRKLFPLEYMNKCMHKNIRPDARKFESFRSVHIQTNVVTTSASSSLVKIGNTSVMTAIKLSVGTPAVATPDQGEIAIQVHLTPLCSTRFTLGRPSEEAQSIGSQLTRLVIGSRVVEMSDLGIERGKSAWKLLIDVYCIDHDGNVHDAALLSIMSALKTLSLPAVKINEADHIVSILPDGDSTPLKLQHTLYASTFALVCDHVVVDPTSEEESLSTTLFSISYNDQLQLVGLHKPGGKLISADTLNQCLIMAKARAKYLEKLLLSM